MDIRDSFSRLKKKVKHRLPGSRRRPDETEPDAEGSLSRPESYFAGGGQEGGEVGAAGQQVQPIDSPLKLDGPEPTPASGSGDQGGEAAVDGRGTNHRYSYLHSDAEVTTGSGLTQEGDHAGEEVKQADPSPSVLPIPQTVEHDST